MKKKLLHKTLGYYILFASMVLLASAPVFYFTTQWLYLRKTSKTLKLNKKEFYKYSLHHLKIEDIKIWNSMDWNIKIKEYEPEIRHDTLFNQLVLDSVEHDYDPYRILLTPIIIDNKPFTLMVRLNLIESDDIIKSTAKVFLGLSILMLTGLYFITKRLSGKLWRPFYETLHQIEKFEIDKNAPLHWIDSDIEEFSRLNYSINRLIVKNIAIYDSQREFIENAAHELQTPLAVFQAKLDTLFQTDHITQPQAEIIEDLNQSISRLNRLNKNLLLLSKLDHNRYPENEELLLNNVIQKHIDFFLVQAFSKKITFHHLFKSEVKIIANALLFDVFISNLLQNAIKYTMPDGIVRIELGDNKLLVSNSGQSGPLDAETMFRRFSKTAANSLGSGLGLAIVKKICEQYQWNIKYSYIDNYHNFEVNFNFHNGFLRE